MRNEALAPPTVTALVDTSIVFTTLLSDNFLNTMLPVTFSTFSLNVSTATKAAGTFIEAFAGDKVDTAGGKISVIEFLGVGGVIDVKSVGLLLESNPTGVLCMEFVAD